MTMTHDTPVSIIEDSVDLNAILSFMISTTPGLQCVSAHTTGEDAYEKIVDDPPDIVLVDLGLPGMSGQECIAKLKSKIPKLCFLVLTIKEQDDEIFSAVRAGAMGYLLKSDSPSSIVSAIRELYDGGAPMSAGIARKITAQLSGAMAETQSLNLLRYLLTSRELDVLECLSGGKFYKEIAVELNISTEMVKVHCRNIYDKLSRFKRKDLTGDALLN